MSVPEAVDLKDENIVIQNPDCHILPTIADVEKIAPFLGQPREYFSEDEIISLTESIKEKGQKDPVSVVEVCGIPGVRYVIVDGEGRWRACLNANVSRVKIYIDRDITTVNDLFSASLILNFHKKPHTHMEISNALKKEQMAGRAVKEIALGVGKSEAWVYQYLSLQNLLPELQELMHPTISNNKRLRFSSALTIASISQKHQKMVYDEISKAKSHKQRQAFARNLVAGLPAAGGKKRKPRNNLRAFLRFVDRIHNDVCPFDFSSENDEFDFFLRVRSKEDLLSAAEKLKTAVSHFQDVIFRIEEHFEEKK